MVAEHDTLPAHNLRLLRALVLHDEQGRGRQRRRRARRRPLRQGPHAPRQREPEEGHLQGRGRLRGGEGRARGGRELPQEPQGLHRHGRAHTQGRAARRPSGHGQDPARKGCRRRGGRAVPLHFRQRLRRALRRRRRFPSARPLRPGEEGGPGHNLHRRDRRRRTPARQRPRRRPRRARADAQPAARRDGRLHQQRGRHSHGGDEPRRHPRQRAHPPGPLRPPRLHRPARYPGPRGHTARPRARQAPGRRRRPQLHRPRHPRLLRRGPGEPPQRGRAHGRHERQARPYARCRWAPRRRARS